MVLHLSKLYHRYNNALLHLQALSDVVWLNFCLLLKNNNLLFSYIYLFNKAFKILRKSAGPLLMPIYNRVRVMLLNATFNNISVISWQSILLVEKTGVPGENHQTVASH